MEETYTVRLNKEVARMTTLSRRESDRIIQEGKVKVNGVIETNPARKVGPQDTVLPLFDSEKWVENKTTLAMYKPKGIVVSHSTREGPTIYSLLTQTGEKLSAIGRLDKDSEGLILVSNDSSLPRYIIGESNRCEKEYIVETRDILGDDIIRKLGKSMNILGRKTLPAKVKKIDDRRFRIILTEGINRQIRRMVRKVGHRVVSLKRIRIGQITLGNLQVGTWRSLSPEEIQQFKS